LEPNLLRRVDKDRARDPVYAFFAVALMAGIGVTLIFLFPGSPEQDSDYHFLMARTAWVDHFYFVQVWARPFFTTLFAPAALFGYTAVRLFALAVSLTMAWQTYRLAGDLHLARPWLVIPILLGQPAFFEIFSDLFTEPLFALVFVLALRWHLRGRIKRGMLVASVLPLARPEGVFLCLSWGLCVLTRRGLGSGSSFRRFLARLPSTLILTVGVVCWWLAALIITGDPLYILHNWPAAWHDNVYGRGTLLSYAQRALEFTGLLLTIPLLLGLWHRLPSHRWRPITTSFMVLFLLHSIFRAYGLFGEAGYPRYMVSVAPATALLTLEGWNALWWDRLQRPLASALGTVILGSSILISVFYLDGMTWARDPIAINEMAAWLTRNPQPLAGLIWSNGRMCTVLGQNLKDSPPPGNRQILMARLQNAPSGTIVFWDDQLGPDWFGLTSAEIEKSGYRRLRTRHYTLHSALYPDAGFALIPGTSPSGSRAPRELELTLLQKP
jgi:hypothetical protein